MDNLAMVPQGYPYPVNPYPNRKDPPEYAPPPPPMYPAYAPPPPMYPAYAPPPPPMYPPYAPSPVAPAPVIIQTITPHRTTDHALCCLICFMTGGLSVPCWIIACLTD